MALESLVSESFLAYQFLLYTKCLGGKEDWKIPGKVGKLKLNLMTLGFQGSFKERGVEISHLLSSYL